MSDELTLKQAIELASIDPLALPEECERLPRQYISVSFAAAELRGQLARADADAKLQEAKLSKAVREAPSDYGLDKVTEAAIRETVATLPQYVTEQRKTFALREQLDKLTGMLTALDMKKRSLTNMVSMTVAGYTGSGPVKVDKEAREDFSERLQRKQAHVAVLRRKGKSSDE